MTFTFHHPAINYTTIKHIILYSILIGFISCQPRSNKLPVNLDEAVAYFENTWTYKEKREFISDSLSNAHTTIGRWIRNNWVHGDRDTALVNYFNKLGIYHPDDISGIILTSLFRMMTNKPIDLEKQIEEYKANWKPIQDCHEKYRKIAMDNF